MKIELTQEEINAIAYAHAHMRLELDLSKNMKPSVRKYMADATKTLAFLIDKISDKEEDGE